MASKLRHRQNVDYKRLHVGEPLPKGQSVRRTRKRLPETFLVDRIICICFYIFLIFAQNIDCGYTLEPPRRGGFDEYPPSMFWSKNMKNRYTSPYPSFAYIKVGYKGVFITRTHFPDESPLF